MQVAFSWVDISPVIPRPTPLAKIALTYLHNNNHAHTVDVGVVRMALEAKLHFLR